MVTWVPTNNQLGIQPITTTSTTQNHPLGQIVQAVDADGTQGAGEFIYLLGVVGTVTGLAVNYDSALGTTSLLPATSTKANGRPFAVAMSANVASQYGWYQVGGAAVIKKTAVKVSPNVALFQSGTAGRVMPTVTSGCQLLGVRSMNAATVASATSTVTVLINRPHAQGQVI